ncbi:thioredoxin-like protein [Bimuria novae-zelandiae CBS 107.79]|uniref:Thioredoxin-like protein n=1 Tax=Bimuria novae-zelandiae CBS 107.79 TaxID=1447943 RepID=A0A6A5VSI9_9PLEO|nr:thioredoxin-like protein [Bimuria novae-zelandiae CBS 107.79]
MRSIFYSLLWLATIATSLAIEPRASDKAADDDWEAEDVVPDTIFNGQTVPPMKELSTDVGKEISHGNWLVEYYSPVCPHCMRMKPIYQTLYEFYYTSKPITTSQETDEDGLNSFTRWYDYKIAKVDCLAFRDVCSDHGINNYPSFVQYKDGKEVSKKVGEHDLKTLSDWVEETLETIKPGSRVQGGPKLPKVGANSVETGPETEGEAKEKEAESAKESTAAAPSKTSEPTKAAKPTPAKPTSTPNASGVSLPLDAEKFQELVTNTLDPWFIKFYAPWCHHCQAMRPNWEHMAREMQGKLNVGEVDCDANGRLCKDAGVKGYPTILFFRGGERTEYNGMRGLGDFIDYANNAVAVGEGIQDVDLAQFKKMEETEEVIFVYFYDHATTSEDFQALDRLTLSLVGKAKLVKTNDEKMSERFKISTWPRMMVSRDGKPTYYGPRTPKEMRDSRKMLTWMKSVWTPIVPELKSDNAREIMDGKMVVLAILDRQNADAFVEAKRELKNAALEWIDKEDQTYQLERQELRDAKQLRIEEAEDRGDQRALRDAKATRIDMSDIKRKQVGFAWVDGVFWERWLRTTFGIDVKDGERVVINDEDNHRYWDTTINGESIRPSRSSILDTVKEVTKTPSSIAPKSSSGTFASMYYFIRHFGTNHPFLAIGLALAGIAVSFMLKKRRRSGGYLQLGEKDGLLGGNGFGKHD